MTATPTFTSRVVISKEKLDSWRASATRSRHLSEDPSRWYNTPTSCHICGKYADRPLDREAHYRDQHDGAIFPEEHPGPWSYGEWACHVCGKGFNTQEPRDAHYKRYHPKVTIKWPDGQPADAWHIRPYYITAERRPFRDAVADIGQTGGSGEVIDVSNMEDEDEDDDIICHGGDAAPPASQNLKRHCPTEVVEIDELDSIVSGIPVAQAGNTNPVGPAARLLAQLNKNDWTKALAQPQPDQQQPVGGKSLISAWALGVQAEMQEPTVRTENNAVQSMIEDDPDPTAPAAPAHIVTSDTNENRIALLPGAQMQLASPAKQSQPASSTKQTPPMSPRQIRAPGQISSPNLKASPNRTPNGGASARLEKSAQRSTLHGRIQRSLYNAGLQFNKISENMTMNEARDHGDGALSDSLKSATGTEPLQSKELDIKLLRPLFDAADLKRMNEELDSVVFKINNAVKTLQSDHQSLTARERIFGAKKEAMNRQVIKIREEQSRRTALIEREYADKVALIERDYADKVALLDNRENDLDDREADVESRENACQDKEDDAMECEGFEDAVEQIM